MSRSLILLAVLGIHLCLTLFRFIFYRKLPISDLPTTARIVGGLLYALCAVVLILVMRHNPHSLFQLKTFWGTLVVFAGLYLYRVVNYPKVRESELPRTYKRVNATLTVASVVILAVAIYRS